MNNRIGGLGVVSMKVCRYAWCSHS